MESKKCSKCDVVKPLDEFYKEKPRKDGHRSDCKECLKQYNSQYKHDNKEKISEQKKQYRQDNKKELNEYQRNRYNNDPAAALRANIKSHINSALKKNNSSKMGESALQYLPYTIEQLKEHLESQFKPGMNWDNRGEWHIDHIYPQSKLPYDSMSHPNFQKAWALENLQPLEASENISKGNKIINE